MEWLVFAALALIAVTMAASMLLTMSMYRAGLALMASLLALAGLFVMLRADLLAAIQVMMNVGGMLIMILFMVMIMMDPGGEMMWDMKRKMSMPGIGALSMSMPRGKPSAQKGGDTHHASVYSCPMHPEVQQDHPGECPKCGMALVPEKEASTEAGHEEASGEDHQQMMVEMAMSVEQLPWAIVFGGLAAVLLTLLFLRTPWPVTLRSPEGNATRIVGHLLLSRYMIAFEGAAFLILAGMVGAVLLGRREELVMKGATNAGADTNIYTCPMHPEVRQQGPGECPICGMRLVPAAEKS